jgi:Ala-tRNA(Pro) deacylase
MFVVGGDRRIDLKTVKKDILGVKNISLASPEEVLEATTCTIGSVPPFGNLFSIPVYLDKHLAQTQEEIVFSAGTHNDSIRMKTKDYLLAVKPIIKEYSTPIDTA